MRRLVTAAWAALLVLALGACVGTPPAPAGHPVGRLTVSVPPALAAAIKAVATQFQTANRGLAVQVDAGPSAQPQGAPDVIISEVRLTGPAPAGAFAISQPVVATEAGNPRQITGLTQLAGLRVALCLAAQPCGSAADELLSGAGVRLTGAIRVSDTSAALAQLRAGRVDAALVYRADARAAGDAVATVELPSSGQARVAFVAEVRNTAAQPELARQFVDFLGGESAQDRLAAFGYQSVR